jgi:hypothetical protein
MVDGVYARLITITRPMTETQVGVVAYQGVLATNEIVIASKVSASIQLDRTGKRPDGGLPGDTVGRGTWKILFNLPLGTVQERDIITDDLANRYQVINAYWNNFGYALLAERLQA